MHKIDTPGADASSEFTSGNAFASIPATTVGHEWLNSLQREIVKVIEDEGITLDKTDDTQLATALAALWLTRLNAEVGQELGFSSAPYGGSSGDGVLIGDTFGIAKATFTTGNPVTLVFYGPAVALPKATPLVITAGDALYWDDSGLELTKTASGNHHAGLATADATSGATTTTVRLFPPGRPAE